MVDIIELRPTDCGAMTAQDLLDRHINAFAVQRLLESVAKSGVLEALADGVSFTLASSDPRHHGIRVTLTPELP